MREINFSFHSIYIQQLDNNKKISFFQVSYQKTLMFDPATQEYEIRKDEPALSVVLVVCVCAIKYSDLRPPGLVPPN